jgi:type VI secretion system secreted protein VgrG
MPDTLWENSVVFRTSALTPGDLFVRRMNGHEGISALFEFEIIAETTFGGALEPDQLSEILTSTAYIAFGPNETHQYHGVVREIEMLTMTEPTPVLYRMKFVPRIFDITLTFGSCVYQNQTVPEIVKSVLVGGDYTEFKDFEFRSIGTYVKQEYVVKYDESDFSFISRLMEHEGIFYFFEHGDHGSKMVIVDSNSAIRSLVGQEFIQYDPRTRTSGTRESIIALSQVRTTIPRKMQLLEFNDLSPSIPLTANANIGADGIGTQTYYAEHYKDTGEGRKLASIRAQEWSARRETFLGESRVRRMYSGHKFALEQHLLSALDREYILTEISHSIEQDAAGNSSGNASDAGYTNKFVAVPSSLPFRPRRIAPKPRVSGVIYGRIDEGARGTQIAQLDRYRRLKVVMPFKAGGTVNGKAAIWVPMDHATTAGGTIPLKPGTVVLLTHINGDPDRPIVTGLLPSTKGRRVTKSSRVNRAN